MITSSEYSNAHSNTLFYEHEVIKFHDKVSNKISFLSVNILISSSINFWFTFTSDSYRCKTLWSSKGLEMWLEEL